MNIFHELLYTIWVSSSVTSLLRCFAHVLILLVSYYWKCYQFLWVAEINLISFYKINGTKVNKNFHKIFSKAGYVYDELETLSKLEKNLIVYDYTIKSQNLVKEVIPYTTWYPKKSPWLLLWKITQFSMISHTSNPLITHESYWFYFIKQ